MPATRLTAKRSARIRTDAKAPVLAATHNQTKNHPQGMVFCLVAAKELIDYTKNHLPILLGTLVVVSRDRALRPVHRIH